MRHFGSSNDTVRCVFMHPARSLLAIAGDAHGNGTVYVYHVKAAKQRGNSPVFRLPRRKPVRMHFPSHLPQSAPGFSPLLPLPPRFQVAAFAVLWYMLSSPLTPSLSPFRFRGVVSEHITRRAVAHRRRL